MPSNLSRFRLKLDIFSRTRDGVRKVIIGLALERPSEMRLTHFFLLWHLASLVR